MLYENYLEEQTPLSLNCQDTDNSFEDGHFT